MILAQVTVERAGVVARAVVEPNPVALIDATTLTLTVEGDAPLTVEPPRFAAPGWTLLGSTATTGEANGRATWRMAFRVSPNRAGDMTLTPPTLQVRAAGRQSPTEIEWAALTVRVETGLTGATIDEAHGVSGPLRPSDDPQSEFGWAFAVVGVIVLAAIVLAWRRRRPPPAVSTQSRTLADLAALAAGDANGLDALVRRYLTSCRDVPAERRTTAELDGAIGPTWLAILRRCELARFAGHAFSDDEWRAALTSIRQQIAEDVRVRETSPVTGSGQFGENASSRGDSADDHSRN